MNYKIWDGIESLVTPTGKVKTAAQILEEYPSAGLPGYKYIICDSKHQLGVFMEFKQTRDVYKKMGAIIEDGMTDQAVLNAMSYLEENPLPVLPSPEERTSAALEFANVLQLPDETKKLTASEASLKRIQSNVDKGLWTDQMIDIVSAKGMIDTSQTTDLKAKVVDISKEK